MAVTCNTMDVIKRSDRHQQENGSNRSIPTRSDARKWNGVLADEIVADKLLPKVKEERLFQKTAST